MELVQVLAMTKIKYSILALLIASYSAHPIAEACKDTADGHAASQELFWKRLEEIRSGRKYPDDVPRGTFEQHHKMEGYDTTFNYLVDVPVEYDPEKKMDLHVYLHGGVNYSTVRLYPKQIRRLKRLTIEDAISIYPSAWTSAKWWYESQSKNIVEIIKIIKKRYNVDDNRVFLHGLSDGAGGVYYFASHRPTPFAGFIALIGSPQVLRPKHNVFGKTFPGNFINKPIFAVNAEDDEFFPAKSVERLFATLNDNGADITFHTVTGNHFGMPWLVKEKQAYEGFVARHTRNPYPDSLYWQIDEGGEFGRIHWLILNGTKGAVTESAVVATKTGNAVHLSSKNVASATLLISSDHFDLSQNIRVWSNEKLVFDQRITPDVRVLDKWFEADGDRSMLFAYELCLDAL